MRTQTLVLLATSAALLLAGAARAQYHDYRGEARVPDVVDEAELDAQHWFDQAQAALHVRQDGVVRRGAARSVVLFLGDGMSVPTLAAARALLGQRKGRPGEEAELSFEGFPVAGLAKTYCVDDQVADSACSATAYLCGVKANRGTLGVTARVERGNCSGSLREEARVDSVAAWALAAGKAVGLVTTTRITHASPAGAFAHSADRAWESAAPDGCDDIALQLVRGDPGRRFKVILGGGLRNFKPTSEGGAREDGRDLVREWLDDERRCDETATFAATASELRAANLSATDRLLGLFSADHAPYHLERNPERDPSLSELTRAALAVLRKSENGFFLFVEGGRIDHAHHDNRALLALDETLEFSEAVGAARGEPDTLLVVTADHSHVMTYNGYSPRGHDILGAARQTDRDGTRYMTLSYANGPGARPQVEGRRADPSAEPGAGLPDWRWHADAPLGSETHGGEDVPVFAEGPGQHVFTGLYEQSQLPHLMGYAACLGPGLHAPACGAAPPGVRALPALLLALTAFILKQLTYYAFG